MLCAKVRLKDAENAKREIIRKGIIDNSYNMKREDGFFYIPVLKKVSNYEIIERESERRKIDEDFASAAKKILSEEELEHFNSAFDLIGDIAVIEIDDELVSKEKGIAGALLKSNSRIKTVVKKGGEHKGEYRLQDYAYLAGEKRFETLHKENGIVLKLDIRKTYYSPRSSGERMRIARQIKQDEKVLVMFSGIGIYGFVFSLYSKAAEISCVEINPDACMYAEESLKLNKKISNVNLFCADVRRFFKDSRERFDRIVMPLPKTASDFLEVAAGLIHKGGIIHFYFFDSAELIKDYSKINGLFFKHFKRFKVLRVVKAGQQSPGVFRLCADIEVL